MLIENARSGARTRRHIQPDAVGRWLATHCSRDRVGNIPGGDPNRIIGKMSIGTDNKLE
jgi:hypothetical protein